MIAQTNVENLVEQLKISLKNGKTVFLDDFEAVSGLGRHEAFQRFKRLSDEMSGDLKKGRRGAKTRIVPILLPPILDRSNDPRVQPPAVAPQNGGESSFGQRLPNIGRPLRQHKFALDDDVDVELMLPRHLTAPEAERIVQFIKSFVR